MNILLRMSEGDALDEPHLFLREAEVQREVLCHVLLAARSREREHPDVPREAEDDLGGSLAECCGDVSHAEQREGIRSEERETLVDDTVLSAERSDVSVPSELGEAAVLHE